MNVARRRFLGTGLASFFGAGINFASAVETPWQRSTKGSLIPALAAYSFRDHFGYIKGKQNKKVKPEDAMDMKGFIHYCAEQGVAAELTSYFFDPDVENAYLTECRSEAHLNGVAIAGTAVGNQFTLEPGSDAAAEQMKYVKTWIDRAVLMGAPHVRVFAGKIPKGMDEKTAEKNATEALSRAGEYAAEKGVFLGIENHDSIGSAEKLLNIVTSVKNPWVGVNLDSGNFRTADPYADFAECVPYAVNIQLKEEIKINEEKLPVDMEKIFSSIKSGGYSGHVVLEFEGKGDPFQRVPELLEEVKKFTR
ncbi:MAG: sugar phosphate isomerase/epimerase [Verrucomicrobiales bacterium]|nr:sugar phosphate isomerase/epimerase [Verrucomicrobiales bacterium]